ncbi:hypothetical protein pqer_cds_326 [Pandoravirus quercus]|uniref:Uncharacterized protein n=1 Tax=Pandoravirus quercus TaxID=2107709 RepID=A0A2U7U8H3_9VIRU|nr:hypothetical protein pqer_cds_326 [Pandoravirus quercus]AVK74748.1 hypothetical protein pqer_cds_326 [Pandoravirus quercus]
MSCAVCDSGSSNNDQAPPPLEWRDWVSLAYDRGHVLRARDCATLMPHETLLLASIDKSLLRQRDETVDGAVPPTPAALFFGGDVEAAVLTGRVWLARGAVRVAMPAACLKEHWPARDNTMVEVGHCSLGWPDLDTGKTIGDASQPMQEWKWQAEAGVPTCAWRPATAREGRATCCGKTCSPCRPSTPPVTMMASLATMPPITTNMKGTWHVGRGAPISKTHPLPARHAAPSWPRLSVFWQMVSVTGDAPTTSRRRILRSGSPCGTLFPRGCPTSRPN